MADHKVGAADSFLKEGEMKRLELEETPLVVAHVEGQYYAFGAECTHYHGPLDEGVLKGHTVICPWHHACFDIRKGTRLEPPALDDVAHFPVRIDNGDIIVTIPQDNEGAPQGKAHPGNEQTFVIVGGGSAGNAAAEELRKLGFTGKITMLSAVPDVPVDRPNLSKDYLAGTAQPEWVPLRGDQSWYEERDIELRLNTLVTKVDPQAHTVHVEHGAPVRYDKLLLATGGTPRHLQNVPGSDLEGIHLLRELADSTAIIKEAEQHKRAVVIGASFIAMEVAASLCGGRGVEVTVVAPEPVPFAKILGEEIGRKFQREHEKHGVQFYLDNGVTRFLEANGRVAGVELKTGQIVPADFVVVGIGVRPATDFLQDSGLKMEPKDQSVRVSAALQASEPDIYAAGDIARWDNGTEGGERIEHWRVAEQHGFVAARNMLGRQEDVLHHVPFFWTTQFDITFNYVGHATQWDEIVYRHGQPEDETFLGFYLHGGTLLAAAGCNVDTELDAIEFIMKERKPLSPQQMRDDSFDLVEYARSQ